MIFDNWVWEEAGSGLAVGRLDRDPGWCVAVLVPRRHRSSSLSLAGWRLGQTFGYESRRAAGVSRLLSGFAIHFEGFDPGSERTLAAWIRHASRGNPAMGNRRKGQ